MRLGIVRGHVVLNRMVPGLEGTRFLMVEPVTAENLAAGNGKGGGKTLVVADHLAPDRGQVVAFVEGREGANAYWPKNVPVDAYCALIVKDVDFPLLPAEHTLPGTEVET
ncbi:MAG: carbon dioxide concentrating mechanism protein CcmL [Acidobacteria bacterium]|nr:carbon dioxide concentrating mechanism protein CcmL [Acidobacteriota bacterium]